MKKIVALLVVLFIFAEVSAVPTITGVSAIPRSVRDGKVDVEVSLTGPSDEVAKVILTFTATGTSDNKNLPVSHIERQGEDVGSGTSWSRHFVWDAKADVGEVKIDDVELTVSGSMSLGGVQLWENGPYWAECNVGATKPEKYGYYFWWGDTVGYVREGGVDHGGYYYTEVAWKSSTGARMSSSPFIPSACPTYGKTISQLQSAGYIDSTGNLASTHDAATVHLGAPWRMPTDAEFAALLNNCDTTWTTCNGVYGYLIKGCDAYSAKSIFLPAAGYSYYFSLSAHGSDGNYWSSTPNSDYSTYGRFFYFNLGNIFRSDFSRHCGLFVRPVRATDGGSDVLLASASTVFSLNDEQTGFIIDSKGVLTGYEGDIPTSIVIPDGVVEISNGVFCYQNITSVKFPNTLKKIGDSAFLNCQLTEVSLPHGIKYIGKAAFKGTNLHQNGESIGTISRVVVENASDLVIDEDAFYGQPVSDVLISGENIQIGANAFYQTYDSYGSYRLDSFAKIVLAGHGICVGEKAFYKYRYGKYPYADLTGVKSVAKEAFYMFGYPGSTYLPSGSIAELGRATMMISKELKYLDSQAFSMSGIGAVYMDEASTMFALENWLLIDAPSYFYHSYLIGGEGIVVGISPWFQSGQYLLDIKIPYGKKVIPQKAFNSSRIFSIDIPKTVKSIEYEAFAYVQGLKSMIFRGDAPNVEANAFRRIAVTSDFKITVFNGTQGWDDDGDGKWNGFTLEFVEPPVQADWSDVEADEDSDMYAGEALGNDHVLAKADLYELKTWANGRYELSDIQANENGLFAFDSSGNPLSKAAEAFLLNCDEDGVEEAKANFKILGMTFAADGLPVFEVNDDAYNGELVFQGSKDFKIWDDLAIHIGEDEECPVSEGYNFFRVQVRLLPPKVVP